MIPDETHKTKGEALAIIAHELERRYNEHDVLHRGEKTEIKFCAYNLLRKKDRPAYVKLFGKPEGVVEEVEEEEEETDERASKPFGWGALIGVTLGSKWRNLGAFEPEEGEELKNDALAVALLEKQTFSQKDLDAFELPALRHDHYIKSGTDYFEPDGLKQPRPSQPAPPQPPPPQPPSVD